MTTTTEQRFKCIECDKSWTGFKMEHCKSCHQTFNNTRAGDKHSHVAFIYTIMRGPDGKLNDVLPDEVKWAILGGYSIVSENNEMIDCLTPEEMRARGMNQEKNGAWNMGGRAYVPKG